MRLELDQNQLKNGIQYLVSQINRKMKKIKMVILALLVTMIITSCSSIMEKKYNNETVKADLVSMHGELDSVEVEIIIWESIRLMSQQAMVSEMTYAEILESGKQWKLEMDKFAMEQAALFEKAKAEEAVKNDRLKKIVVVSCLDKGFLAANFEDWSATDYNDYITYKFYIMNNSDKEIRAVKGKVIFTDLFDKLVREVNFVFDESIEAGKYISWNAQTVYNSFLPEDVIFKNKPLKNMKVVWKPEKVIFSDGTVIE